MIYRPYYRINLFLFFLPLAVMLFLYLTGSGLLSASKQTWLQLGLYPFVLLGLGRILGKEFRVPAILYFLASTLALVGVVYAYVYPLKAKRGGLVVARLKEDELQNETRIFREQINRALDQNGTVRAVSMNESFETIEEAESFMAENRKVKILISGDKNWINIYFPKKEPKSLGDMGLSLDLFSLKELKLHYAVQEIGISRQPSVGTAIYLANLAEGVLNQELSLIYAARINYFWTSFAHKAYPLWYLGNVYLESSLKNGKLSRNILNCGIKAYRKALSYLRVGDSPDLKASIHNNLGVAYVLRGYLVGKKRDLSKGKKFFQLSLKIYREKSKLHRNFTAAGVAIDNLATLGDSRIKFGKAKDKVKKGQRVQNKGKKKNGKKKVGKKSRKKKANDD